jgi:hypothetical protein
MFIGHYAVALAAYIIIFWPYWLHRHRAVAATTELHKENVSRTSDTLKIKESWLQSHPTHNIFHFTLRRLQ